jgi:hypothetical protein
MPGGGCFDAYGVELMFPLVGYGSIRQHVMA